MPTTTDHDMLEIELENYGTTAWWRTVAATLTSQYGTQPHRFVARGTADGRPTVEGASGTFPVQPLELPLDSMGPDDGWQDEARARLRELEESLQARGWHTDGQGPHWWSKRYTRPRR